MDQNKTISIRCEGQEYHEIEDLIPFQGKLKSISSDNFHKLKESIKSDGIPLGFHIWKQKDKTYIMDGHHRKMALQALKDEGYFIPPVPCNIVIAKTKKEAAKVVLISNSKYSRVSEESLSDFMIDMELKVEDLENLDIPELSMDDFEPENESKDGLTDDDSVPEVDQNIHGVSLCDIYQLGNHRLMCGDSTSIDAVERLMGKSEIELCFTSPPYADQREYNGEKDLSTEHLATFIRTSFNKVKYFAVNLGYSRKNGEVNQYWDDYIKEAKACGLKFLSWNIWDRVYPASIAQQTAMFPVEHEWVFVFGNTEKELNKTLANKTAGGVSMGTTNRQTDGTLKRGKRREVGTHRALGTILECDIHRGDSPHPAMFPVQFPESYIYAMTNPGQSVYEPFGGSGSTLIACEKTNRKCFMMELDPHYCSVIIERWQQFTGQKAVKIDAKMMR